MWDWIVHHKPACLCYLSCFHLRPTATKQQALIPEGLPIWGIIPPRPLPSSQHCFWIRSRSLWSWGGISGMKWVANLGWLDGIIHTVGFLSSFATAQTQVLICIIKSHFARSWNTPSTSDFAQVGGKAVRTEGKANYNLLSSIYDVLLGLSLFFLQADTQNQTFYVKFNVFWFLT